MQGRRVEPPESQHLIEPGDYYKDSEGYWRGCTPNGLHVWLKNHRVIEHEDGTISVPRPGSGEPANSILAKYSEAESWHGFINRGKWEAC